MNLLIIKKLFQLIDSFFQKNERIIYYISFILIFLTSYYQNREINDNIYLILEIFILFLLFFWFLFNTSPNISIFFRMLITIFLIFPLFYSFFIEHYINVDYLRVIIIIPVILYIFLSYIVIKHLKFNKLGEKSGFFILLYLFPFFCCTLIFIFLNKINIKDILYISNFIWILLIGVISKYFKSIIFRT